MSSSLSLKLRQKLPLRLLLIPPAAISRTAVVHQSREYTHWHLWCFMMSGNITCYWSRLSLVIVRSSIGSSWQRDSITVTCAWHSLVSQVAPCLLWHLCLEHHSLIIFTPVSEEDSRPKLSQCAVKVLFTILELYKFLKLSHSLVWELRTRINKCLIRFGYFFWKERE